MDASLELLGLLGYILGVLYPTRSRVKSQVVEYLITY